MSIYAPPSMNLSHVRELLDINPNHLQEPIPWELFLRPILFAHASTFDLTDERKKRGLDPEKGLAGDPRDRGQAWATACYIATRAGDIETERFRLRAVQIAIREKCGAWHAGAVAAGQVDRCPCARCEAERAS